MSDRTLSTHPVHLGLGATVEVEDGFDGTVEWYQDYMARHASDGAEARLVSLYEFEESWDMWEMHPSGSELVLCMAGFLTMHQEEEDGTVTATRIGPGEYVINPPGTWHTADAEAPVTALFITAGLGTQHRPR